MLADRPILQGSQGVHLYIADILSRMLLHPKSLPAQAPTTLPSGFENAAACQLAWQPSVSDCLPFCYQIKLLSALATPYSVIALLLRQLVPQHRGLEENQQTGFDMLKE